MHSYRSLSWIESHGVNGSFMPLGKQIRTPINSRRRNKNKKRKRDRGRGSASYLEDVQGAVPVEEDGAIIPLNPVDLTMEKT